MVGGDDGDMVGMRKLERTAGQDKLRRVEGRMGCGRMKGYCVTHYPPAK